MTESEEDRVEMALQTFANTAFAEAGSVGYSRAPWEVIDGLQKQLKEAVASGVREDIAGARKAVRIAIAWRDAMVTAGLIDADDVDDHDWTLASK